MISIRPVPAVPDRSPVHGGGQVGRRRPQQFRGPRRPRLRSGRPRTPLGLTDRTPPACRRGRSSSSGRTSPATASVEADPLGGDGQHERGLGAAGVEVTVPSGPPPGDRSALVGQAPQRAGQWCGIAAVGAGQHHVGEVTGGRPPELDQQLLGRLPADGEGAGEAVVLAGLSRRPPPGPTSRRGSSAAAASTTATAMSVSVVTGRWGPCCSVAPDRDDQDGTVGRPRASSAIAGQVDVGQPGHGVPLRRRGAAPSLATCPRCSRDGPGRPGARRPPPRRRRVDHRRRVVGHQGPGQGEQARPRVGAVGGRAGPGSGAVKGRGAPMWTVSGPTGLTPSATASERSTGVGRRRRPSAPASEARRRRTPAPSTEQTAGRGTRSRSRHPPSRRRSTTRARPRSAACQGDQPEGLGGSELVGQVGGQGARCRDRPSGRRTGPGRDGRTGRMAATSVRARRRSSPANSST